MFLGRRYHGVKSVRIEKSRPKLYEEAHPDLTSTLTQTLSPNPQPLNPHLRPKWVRKSLEPEGSRENARGRIRTHENKKFTRLVQISHTALLAKTAQSSTPREPPRIYGCVLMTLSLGPSPTGGEAGDIPEVDFLRDFQPRIFGCRCPLGSLATSQEVPWEKKG